MTMSRESTGQGMEEDLKSGLEGAGPFRGDNSVEFVHKVTRTRG